MNEPAHHFASPGKPILKYSPAPTRLEAPDPGQLQGQLQELYKINEEDTPASANTGISDYDPMVPEALNNDFWAPGHWKAATQNTTAYALRSGEKAMGTNAPLNLKPIAIPASSTSADSNQGAPPSSPPQSDSAKFTAQEMDESQGVPAPAFKSSIKHGWFPDFHPAYESNYVKRRPAPQFLEDGDERPTQRARSFPSQSSFTFLPPKDAPSLQRQHSIVTPYSPHPWTPNPFEADFVRPPSQGMLSEKGHRHEDGWPPQRTSAYFSPVITPSANPWEDEPSGPKRKAEENNEGRKRRRVAFVLPKSFRSDQPRIVRQQTPYYQPTFKNVIRLFFKKLLRPFRSKTDAEKQEEKERRLRERRDEMEEEESEQLREHFRQIEED